MAQWVDAQLPRRGEVQVGISGTSITTDRRFLADGTNQPLSEALALNLDNQIVPALNDLDTALAALFASLDLGDTQSSTLGPVSYDVLLERTRLPISVTFGLTDWLAPFAVVPIAIGKSFVGTELDSMLAEAGETATAFGENPDAFFASLESSISQLESIVQADTLSSGLQSQAEALLSDAQTLEAGLADLRALEYMLTSTGVNGASLLAFYEQMRSGFSTFEVDLAELDLAQPIDGELARELSSGPEFGIEPLQNRDTGFRFGDIEVGVRLQPLNTFPRRPGEPISTFSVRVRARFDALWRFASGSEPAANRITDVGTGDGQPDLEFRTAWDLTLGRRFWLSAFGSYNIQLEADIERLITDRGSPIQLGAFTTPVRWDPGDVLTLVAAPRFNLTQDITFSFLYVYARQGHDNVSPTTGTATDGAFSLSDIEQGTKYSARSVGFAARYASTSWSGHERPGIPAEVEFRYLNTTSGSGGFAPDRNVWEVAVRLYKTIFR